MFTVVDLLALRHWIYGTYICIVITKLAFNPNVYEMREIGASGLNIVTSAPVMTVFTKGLECTMSDFGRRRGFIDLLDLHP